MCEIKAKPSRFDDAPSLFDVRAEHLPECRVQKVRRSMVPHRGMSQHAVYSGRDE
jgi:hypothetical protein